ncbi:MAG: glycerate kinase [Pyrinomonadaceae bacterium]
MANSSQDLRRAALDIFTAALQSADAYQAVRRALQFDKDAQLLRIVNSELDLRAYANVYSIAIGKAACAMATALTDVLGDKLAGGVVSSAEIACAPSRAWQTFAGGHPLPNEASIAAAQATVRLLRQANASSSLIIFLVSGGGSAMLELPRFQNVTLADLRATNNVLVNCGATITEINSVRRALSAIKGGGLSVLAPRAAQVTLIISDTNRGDEASVASGPSLPASTFSADNNGDAADITAIIARHNLHTALPQTVLRALEESQAKPHAATNDGLIENRTPRSCYVLLDNDTVLASAAAAARARGFIVEVASDLIEQSIGDGCRQLVARLFDLRARTARGNTACLISGGEFACPVRGSGIGGRNAEAALRCAIEIDARKEKLFHAPLNHAENSYDGGIVALHAGTDGIDGNSPAAGALADAMTLERAAAKNLNAREFLECSDAYSFFQTLGDTILTGATGTNVRDLRIMLAA